MVAAVSGLLGTTSTACLENINILAYMHPRSSMHSLEKLLLKNPAVMSCCEQF